MNASQHQSSGCVPMGRLESDTAQPGPLSEAGIGEAAQLEQHEVDNQPQEGSWTLEERDAFNLGMCLFGKYFPAIQSLVGTKAVRALAIVCYSPRHEKMSAKTMPARSENLGGTNKSIDSSVVILQFAVRWHRLASCFICDA